MTPEAFLGLYDTSGRFSFSDLKAGAAAIQAQLTEDYLPVWGRKATYTAFQDASQLPAHYWPQIIQDDIGQPGALGFHTDDLGQPKSFIAAEGGNLLAMLVTAGHEGIESVGDFSGNRLIPSWHPTTGEPVRILCEECDMPEAITYQKGGFDMTDFIRPEWFDQNKTDNLKYSYCDSLPGPRTIIAGGYMSFVDAKGQCWQLTWFDDSGPQLQGPFDWGLGARGNKSLREHVDSTTRELKAKYGLK